MPLIAEPRRVPWPLRAGVWWAERTTGRRMVPARLLAWTPRLALGSGAMEAFVEHERPSPRLLRLARLTASLTVGCAFCLDLNAHERDRDGVTDAELDALRHVAAATEGWEAGALGSQFSWNGREAVVVAVAHGLSLTPPDVPGWVRQGLVAEFEEPDVVRVVSTIAQVNHWARFNVGLGVPPAGFTDACGLPG